MWRKQTASWEFVCKSSDVTNRLRSIKATRARGFPFRKIKYEPLERKIVWYRSQTDLLASLTSGLTV
jgi:hypothetical protein